MKLQRPQYLMAAILLLVLGLQCLYVDSYILTPEASNTLSSQLEIPPPAGSPSDSAENQTDPTDPSELTETPKSNDDSTTLSHEQLQDDTSSGQYTLVLPDWLAWLLLGASLICFLRTIPWFAPSRS